MQLMNINIEGDAYCCCLTKIAEDESIEDADVSFFKLLSELKRNIRSDKSFNVFHFNCHDRFIVSVFYGNGGDSIFNEIHKLMSNNIKKITAVIGANVVIVVGNIVDNCDNIHESYNSALAELEMTHIRNKMKNPLISNLISRLNDQYDLNISLRTMADDLYVNPAYLGQLFIKEMNVAFTDYLNSIRVSKAKELLINTNMKVNDISVKVGYMNHHYFHRVFSKLSGVSPGKFRANYYERL